ncbi:MAG: acyl-ACP--UDP-N-acetylglucosamine O-acyltransferase [Rhodospirillales bacterium]|nr:acyl-ACP--UDP-N-acetylglucosamine O-acyltransferase [Alphaproteobacteria bacterium]MCB1839365.1 acyl-ACP--UDP-N-acetylglucosamine O-acyltransferase [Alphaproteobacteria bacterium]MCB9977429.1 acyl-ACP--UDP-N-acetylglucosamine O-acyltransferase [Rhodospirillales bacterium]
MSQTIHPTAIVSPKAEIPEEIMIGPYCVIGPDVRLGKGVRLVSHVYIEGATTIGENTIVYPFASLGTPPQDLKYAGEKSELIIGKNNTIREHVTMNPGTQQGAMKTIIGDNGLFMMATHVAHDCVIGNNVIMANNATLGGHVHIGDFAVLGGLSAVHQFVRIGSHAIVGGMSGVENDVIPFGRVKGERAFLAGLNLIGLERRGFTKDKIKNLQRAFNQMFGDEGTLDQRIEMVAADFAEDDLIMSVITFAREKSKFPLCQPQKK